MIQAKCVHKLAFVHVGNTWRTSSCRDTNNASCSSSVLQCLQKTQTYTKCTIICKHIMPTIKQHIGWRRLGNWWSRNICKRDIRGRPSFASGMFVCVCESGKSVCVCVWVCVVLQEYYVTCEWCNAVSEHVSSWWQNPPLTHLSSPDKLTRALGTSLPSQPVSRQTTASWLEMAFCQSIKIFFFFFLSCCGGLKHLIHFIPWRWSPKSAHLIWATDFVRREVGDCWYVSVESRVLVTSWIWLDNSFGHQTELCVDLRRAQTVTLRQNTWSLMD